MSDLSQDYVEGAIVGLSPWETFEVSVPASLPLFPVEEFYHPPLDLFSADPNMDDESYFQFIAFLQAAMFATTAEKPIQGHKEKYTVNPETGNYRIIR